LGGGSTNAAKGTSHNHKKGKNLLGETHKKEKVLTEEGKKPLTGYLKVENSANSFIKHLKINHKKWTRRRSAKGTSKVPKKEADQEKSKKKHRNHPQGSN